MYDKADRDKRVLIAVKQLQQQLQQQEKLLNEVLVEIKKEQKLPQPTKQQEQPLNEILVETKKDPLPSLPQPSKSPFSMLESLDLDMEKITKIALFISSLYMEDKAQPNRDK